MKLTNAQLELMASYSNSDSSIPTVSVTANREYNDGDYNFWEHSSGGGGGGEVPGCTTHSSPAPNLVPTGVNLEKLRDLVQKIASEMATKSYFATNEQGAFILREANGDLTVTTVQVGSKYGVSYEASPINGQIIVASVHSHTTLPGSDSRIP